MPFAHCGEYEEDILEDIPKSSFDEVFFRLMRGTSEPLENHYREASARTQDFSTSRVLTSYKGNLEVSCPGLEPGT